MNVASGIRRITDPVFANDAVSLVELLDPLVLTLSPSLGGKAFGTVSYLGQNYSPVVSRFCGCTDQFVHACGEDADVTKHFGVVCVCLARTDA